MGRRRPIHFFQPFHVPLHLCSDCQMASDRIQHSRSDFFQKDLLTNKRLRQIKSCALVLQKRPNETKHNIRPNGVQLGNDNMLWTWLKGRGSYFQGCQIVEVCLRRRAAVVQPYCKKWSSTRTLLGSYFLFQSTEEHACTQIVVKAKSWWFSWGWDVDRSERD